MPVILHVSCSVVVSLHRCLKSRTTAQKRWRHRGNKISRVHSTRKLGLVVSNSGGKGTNVC